MLAYQCLPLLSLPNFDLLLRRNNRTGNRDSWHDVQSLGPGALTCTWAKFRRPESGVISHLVQNALNAVAANGVVALRVYRDGGFKIVEFWDNGSGMSPELVRHELFKPFRTTKAAGMGIGVVYESSQYVTELGGRLSVDSKPGAGTCVKVPVPRTLDGQALQDRREMA